MSKIPLRVTWTLALFLSCASPSFSQSLTPSGLDDRRGIFRPCILRGRDLRIILAQVNPTTPEFKSSTTDSWIAHEITVLCEYRRSLAEGSRIHLVNKISPVGGGTGSAPLSISWEPGTIFLMVVAPTTEKETFEWAGRTNLIGVEIPSSVKPTDVPLIKTAVLKLGEIAQSSDSMLGRDEALRLLDVNDNYYLWALGAAALAAQNDVEAHDELYKRWVWTTKPLLTPRQIVWLDYCLQQYMSDELKPTASDRNQMFLNYLQRLDPVSPPSTTRSGFGR